MAFSSYEDLKNYLKVGTEAALRGGEVLKKYWGKLSQVREKGFGWDLVTEADLESEKAILEFLYSKFPTHETLSEEAGLGAKKESEFLWVIDPLDGTTNYTHQYPIVAVSIGLLYQGDPIVGIVYNPIFNEMFQSIKGHGVELNGSKIKVSSVNVLEKSLLATGFAYDRKENPENNYAEFCQLTQNSQGVRRGGAAAIDLAYVAAGRLDGFWERGLKPWDMAAGSLMVLEAGGTVTDYDLKPFDIYSGRIVATNGKIQKSLSDQIVLARQG